MEGEAGVEAVPSFVEEAKPSFGKQLRAFLLKNLTMQWRHKCMTIFELLLPALFSVLVCIIMKYALMDDYTDLGVVNECLFLSYLTCLPLWLSL